MDSDKIFILVGSFVLLGLAVFVRMGGSESLSPLSPQETPLPEALNYDLSHLSDVHAPKLREEVGALLSRPEPDRRNHQWELDREEEMLADSAPESAPPVDRASLHSSSQGVRKGIASYSVFVLSSSSLSLSPASGGRALFRFLRAPQMRLNARKDDIRRPCNYHSIRNGYEGRCFVFAQVPSVCGDSFLSLLSLSLSLRAQRPVSFFPKFKTHLISFLSPCCGKGNARLRGTV